MLTRPSWSLISLGTPTAPAMITPPSASIPLYLIKGYCKPAMLLRSGGSDGAVAATLQIYCGADTRNRERLRNGRRALVANGGSVGFSIGEVSQAIGLAPQTLRLWERERLVRPRRTDRGYRVYTEPDVERLRTIKQLRKGEGLNFAAIRKQLGPAAEEPREDGSAETDDAVGERLRRLRTRAHKTLKEVSETTGLSIS